jgi:hypothetical protein
MKKILSLLVVSMGILLSNGSIAFADAYGHEPVPTSFVLDIKTVSAILALLLFAVGSSLIVEGKYFKSASM